MLRSHTNARVLMAKMRWWDHLSNEALWLHYSTVCGVEDSAGEGEKTEWFGHVKRRDEDNPVNVAKKMEACQGNGKLVIRR